MMWRYLLVDKQIATNKQHLNSVGTCMVRVLVADTTAQCRPMDFTRPARVDQATGQRRYERAMSVLAALCTARRQLLHASHPREDRDGSGQGLRIAAPRDRASSRQWCLARAHLLARLLPRTCRSIRRCPVACRPNGGALGRTQTRRRAVWWRVAKCRSLQHAGARQSVPAADPSWPHPVHLAPTAELKKHRAQSSLGSPAREWIAKSKQTDGKGGDLWRSRRAWTYEGRGHQ